MLAATPTTASQAIATLVQLSPVAYAELNWVYTLDVEATDPYFTYGSLWGMNGDASSPANAFGSQAAEAGPTVTPAWPPSSSGSSTKASSLAIRIFPD